MIEKAIAIAVGSILLGIGINVFLVPYELLDGGMIGISLIIKYIKNEKMLKDMKNSLKEELGSDKKREFN